MLRAVTMVTGQVAFLCQKHDPFRLAAIYSHFDPTMARNVFVMRINLVKKKKGRDRIVSNERAY